MGFGLLFPGQGSLNIKIINSFLKYNKFFKDYYKRSGEIINVDIIKMIESYSEVF